MCKNSAHSSRSIVPFSADLNRIQINISGSNNSIKCRLKFYFREYNKNGNKNSLMKTDDFLKFQTDGRKMYRADALK